MSVTDILNERLKVLRFPDSDCFVIVGSNMSTRLKQHDMNKSVQCMKSRWLTAYQNENIDVYIFGLPAV